ncbi:MAG TPA: Ig-like domain-containing protein [Planctomycetota bacterium]|nr:Ig-like domain-containing protein [Planctomycetota bacterium]
MLRRFLPLFALVGIAGYFVSGCSSSSSSHFTLNPLTMTITPNHLIPADGITSATITIVARDSSGGPIKGEMITLTATGSGNIITQPGPTDTTGTATGHIASTVPETKNVTATAAATGSVASASVTFVPAQSASSGTLGQISGNNQTGQRGTTLPLALLVRVLGSTGQPIANVPVTFTPTAGGGTVSQTNVTTDANGNASTMLTLGPNPGNNTVTVVALNEQGQQLQGSPVIFNETAQ